MSDEKFLAACRKRFQRAIDSVKESRTSQVDDVKFAAGSPDNGWQWPQDVLKLRQNDPNGARPTLTINKLPQHIKLVTNEQRQNRPAGRVLPVNDEGDPEVAEILSGIIRHIEVSSNADVAYDTACENQVTHGEGYWRILTDYVDDTSNDQDIQICPIKNSFSVYLDPDGLRQDATGMKCQWGFITDQLSEDEFESEFPNAKSMTNWEPMADGDEMRLWFENGNVRIAEYFYFETTESKLTVGDKTRTIKNKKLKWCKLNGFEILDEKEWAGKYIPIVRVVGNEWEVEGKIVTSGIVRNAKDAMRMYNYWASQEAELLALAPKAPFIGAVGQFETMNQQWGNANTVSYSRLEYDPIDVNGTPLPAPQRQMPPMAPQGLIEAKMAAADDIQSTVGQYNPSLGAEAKEKSGKAIQARQRQADVGTFHYVDNLSRGIRYSTVICLDLIPRIYDTQRVARIIGEDGEPDNCKLDPSQDCAVSQSQDETGAIQKIYNPNVGRYDVVVTVGPSYTTKRMEAQEGMATLIGANENLWQVVGDLFVKNMDWPGAEEMAKRIRKTIPPQILQDDNPDPNDMDQKMAQVQQAAHALGQREAQLNHAHEQIMAQGQEAQDSMQKATKAQQDAKDAALKVEQQVVQLNELQAEIRSASEKLQLTEKLANANMDARQAVEQAKFKEAMAEVELMLTKHQDAVEEMIEKSMVTPPTPALPDPLMQAITESTQQTSEAIRSMMQALSADRETQLLTDDQGNPTGAVSRLKVVA